MWGAKQSPSCTSRMLSVPFMHFFSFSFFPLNFQFSKELHCLFVHSLFELQNTNLVLKQCMLTQLEKSVLQKNVRSTKRNTACWPALRAVHSRDGEDGIKHCWLNSGLNITRKQLLNSLIISHFICIHEAVPKLNFISSPLIFSHRVLQCHDIWHIKKGWMVTV